MNERFRTRRTTLTNLRQANLATCIALLDNVCQTERTWMRNANCWIKRAFQTFFREILFFKGFLLLTLFWSDVRSDNCKKYVTQVL